LRCIVLPFNRWVRDFPNVSPFCRSALVAGRGAVAKSGHYADALRAMTLSPDHIAAGAALGHDPRQLLASIIGNISNVAIQLREFQKTTPIGDANAAVLANIMQVLA